MIGESGVGKSTLVSRFRDNKFVLTEPTVNVEFTTKILPLVAGETGGNNVKIQIWDTAGQVSCAPRNSCPLELRSAQFVFRGAEHVAPLCGAELREA
jgi:small GTP-binding protein